MCLDLADVGLLKVQEGRGKAKAEAKGKSKSEGKARQGKARQDKTQRTTDGWIHDVPQKLAPAAKGSSTLRISNGGWRGSLLSGGGGSRLRSE